MDLNKGGADGKTGGRAMLHEGLTECPRDGARRLVGGRSRLHLDLTECKPEPQSRTASAGLHRDLQESASGVSAAGARTASLHRDLQNGISGARSGSGQDSTNTGSGSNRKHIHGLHRDLSVDRLQGAKVVPDAFERRIRSSEETDLGLRELLERAPSGQARSFQGQGHTQFQGHGGVKPRQMVNLHADLLPSSSVNPVGASGYKTHQNLLQRTQRPGALIAGSGTGCLDQTAAGLRRNPAHAHATTSAAWASAQPLMTSSEGVAWEPRLTRSPHPGQALAATATDSGRLATNYSKEPSDGVAEAMAPSCLPRGQQQSVAQGKSLLDEVLAEKKLELLKSVDVMAWVQSQQSYVREERQQEEQPAASAAFGGGVVNSRKSHARDAGDTGGNFAQPEKKVRYPTGSSVDTMGGLADPTPSLQTLYNTTLAPSSLSGIGQTDIGQGFDFLAVQTSGLPTESEGECLQTAASMASHYALAPSPFVTYYPGAGLQQPPLFSTATHGDMTLSQGAPVVSSPDLAADLAAALGQAPGAPTPAEAASRETQQVIDVLYHLANSTAIATATPAGGRHQLANPAATGHPSCTPYPGPSPLFLTSATTSSYQTSGFHLADELDHQVAPPSTAGDVTRSDVMLDASGSAALQQIWSESASAFSSVSKPTS